MVAYQPLSLSLGRTQPPLKSPPHSSPQVCLRLTPPINSLSQVSSSSSKTSSDSEAFLLQLGHESSKVRDLLPAGTYGGLLDLERTHLCLFFFIVF
jgi:hypothetical protein